MQKKWVIKQAEEEKVTALCNELKIRAVLSRILVQRGIETAAQAKSFFCPSLDDLHDPFLMKGMSRAVERIEQALRDGERLLIYGDYDVDGTTAVATVYSFFRALYPHIDYYVPNRYTEGYGISFKGIDYAEAAGCRLIIALDCGIKAVDKVNYARQKGIDLIICDHHLPGNELPQAFALLDPKQTDCAYPYKELSGCGVGFKLIQAFARRNGIADEKWLQYLDLVCVSIGADIVPITGENRVLAWHGLKKLNTHPAPGLGKLLALSGSAKELTITDVVFRISPRINAAGRMEDARHAVKLLIADDEDSEGMKKAYTLNEFNNERKNLDRDITAHALAMIRSDEVLVGRKSTVVYHEDWHKGVIGIVASRLTETYYRPTVVLTRSEGKISGSARSVKDFDLYEAIYECRDLLLQFGGHKFAAGLTLLPENIELFSQRFEEVVSSRITEQQLTPEIDVDAVIDLECLTPKFYAIIQRMQPFGPGNMNPIFLTENVTDSGWSRVLKEDHIRFSIRAPHNESITGIGFGLADKFPIVQSAPFDMVYHLEENEWNDEKRLQLIVKDIRKHE